MPNDGDVEAAGKGLDDIGQEVPAEYGCARPMGKPAEYVVKGIQEPACAINLCLQAFFPGFAYLPPDIAV